MNTVIFTVSQQQKINNYLKIKKKFEWGIEIGCPMELTCIADGRFGILLSLDPKKLLIKVWKKENF